MTHTTHNEARFSLRSHAAAKWLGLMFSAALLLTGCGGGGGGGGGASEPVVPKTWKTAQLLETIKFGNAENMRLAMNSNGSAMAVWQQLDLSNNISIFARAYTPENNWGLVSQFKLVAQDAANAEVAMDSTGRAIAVWQQFDGVRNNIWFNRYVPGSGWGMANLLENDNVGSAEHPAIAMDPAGNAIAVWQQNEGLYFNMKAKRFDALANTWGSLLALETEELGHASSADVAMDNNGNAMVVWRQDDGARDNIWANRYTVGVGFGPAEKIDSLNTTALEPKVAMDSAGNAMAVWRQVDAGIARLIAKLYKPASGWSSSAFVGGDVSGISFSPMLAFQGVENATFVWHQDDGNNTNIMTNKFDLPVKSLGQPKVLSAGVANSPQIAFDASGHAVVVWSQSDGVRQNIWSAAISPTGQLGKAEMIETNNSGSATEPQLGVAADGSAVVIWKQVDGPVTDIWANVKR